MDKTPSMFGRVEQWFAAPEQNAAGRLGLYRILYGLWFLWLLSKIDFPGIAARPTPPPAPVGVIKIMVFAGAMRHPDLVAYGLALGLGFGLTLLTFGLATRLSTFSVLMCGGILFAWDSSFGKVIDKYVLLGSLVPFWMLFSRWGETYSLDALIRKARGRPTPSVSDSGWEFGWSLRAVVIFIAVLYFSAGWTKVTGSWLHNPYVLLNKITSNATLASIGQTSPVLSFLYRLTTTAPAVFIVAQYVSLLFELAFPLALVNRELRTFMFSAAALFHTLTSVVLSIAFAPMIIVLAIVVDWQALYERFWPFARYRWRGPSRTLLFGLIGLALVLSAVDAWLLTSYTHAGLALRFLPKQELVWFLAAPFAALAIFKSGRHLYVDLRARFTSQPSLPA